VKTLEVEGHRVHSLDEGALLVCVEREQGLDLAFVRALADLKPRRAVLLDAGFGSDSLKVNAQETFSVMRGRIGREIVLSTI